MTVKVRKIEVELEEKTRELAEFAETIMEKQEFVRLVENGLNKLLAAQPERKDSLARDLLKSIKAAGDTRRDWDELTRKFLLLHQSFAERLLQVAPNMTVAELKICVLLRLDMESKGIADVLQVAVKTVRNHRQNIREKLPLEEGENLKKYLMLLDASDEDAATNNSK
jgi:DNA-binding CsgD family transcriptional regulator